MALARVSTGDPGVATNIDQFVDLLTGVMIDQPVTLKHASTPLSLENTVGTGYLQVRTDNSTTDPGMPWIRSDSNILVINPRAGHDMFVMWDGGAGTFHIGPSVAVTLKVGEGSGAVVCGTITTGAISATSGSFSAAVTSNSHPVVEGTAAVTHLEVLPPQGSSGLIGSGSIYGLTLNFARAFAGSPSVQGNGHITGASPFMTTSLSSVSTSSATITFRNCDPGNQTITSMCITAAGV